MDRVLKSQGEKGEGKVRRRNRGSSSREIDPTPYSGIGAAEAVLGSVGKVRRTSQKNVIVYY